MDYTDIDTQAPNYRARRQVCDILALVYEELLTNSDVFIPFDEAAAGFAAGMDEFGYAEVILIIPDSYVRHLAGLSTRLVFKNFIAEEMDARPDILTMSIIRDEMKSRNQAWRELRQSAQRIQPVSERMGPILRKLEAGLRKKPVQVEIHPAG